MIIECKNKIYEGKIKSLLDKIKQILEHDCDVTFNEEEILISSLHHYYSRLKDGK